MDQRDAFKPVTCRVLCALAALLAWHSRATAEEILPGDVPACRAGPRLHAVRYDARSAQRSFAVFGVGAEQRPQIFRPGARIAGYELASVLQGGVLLSTQTQQRCSLRLRGAAVERELRAIPAAAVRGALRARKDGVRVAREVRPSGPTI